MRACTSYAYIEKLCTFALSIIKHTQNAENERTCYDAICLPEDGRF